MATLLAATTIGGKALDQVKPAFGGVINSTTLPSGSAPTGRS